jgi:ankyrin repeat protein
LEFGFEFWINLILGNNFKFKVEILLEARADPNARTADSVGQTALIRAAMGGHRKIAEILLRAGADVNTKSDKGWTALTAVLHKCSTMTSVPDQYYDIVSLLTCPSLSTRTDVNVIVLTMKLLLRK